jgi:hypothetical protein
MRAPQEFDPESVRCGAAALALWPRNADRMRALAALTRALPLDGRASPGGNDAPDPRRRPPITPAGWRAWFNSEDSRAIRDTVPDGVFDAPTYVEAELLGARFRLMAGYLDAPDVHYRLWMEALRHIVIKGTDSHVGAATRLLLATAGLSEMVVRRAGIELGLPDHLPEGLIEIPDDDVYERLCHGVEIRLDEVGDGVVQPDALGPLVATPATAPRDRWRTPIVLHEDRLLLAGPRDLLLAGLIHAAEMALESPSWEPLLRRLNAAALSLVEQIAADMDWELVEREGTRLLLRFDSDKLAVVDFVGGPISPFGTPIASAGRDVEIAYDRLAAWRTVAPKVQLGLVVLLGDGRPVEAPLPESMEPPFGPWIITLAGLRLLGDAFKLDPLQLWRLLRRMPPQPWPDDTELLEVVGLLRRRYESADALYEPLPTGRGDSDSGIEHLHRRALMMASRHTAPRPDGEGWVTVSRWRGTPDRAVFAPEEDVGPFALCVRGPGRYCWIVAGAEVADDRNDALGVFVRLVAFWAARLVEAGWLIVAEELEPSAEGVELGVRIVVSFEDHDGPALALGGAPGLGRLVFGPAFLHVMARGDNVADRMVVWALADWWLGPSGRELAVRLRDHVAPMGHATFAIWPNPLTRRVGHGIEDVDPVPADERQQVQLDVAGNVVDESQILYAQGEQAREILARVNRLVVALLDYEIDRCSPDLLLELLRVHERVRRLQEAHSVFRPSVAAMPDPDPLTGGLDADELGALAIRWLIERVGARPPTGHVEPSRALMERL